jgi:hypothetical protein
MNRAPAIAAPENLLALFKGEDGASLAIPVVAFDQRGVAMVPDFMHGRLKPVDEIDIFLHLEWS